MPIFYLSESSINDYQKIEFELIEKETNKASKIIFGKFKNIFNKNDKSDYNQFRLEELKQFYKDNKDFPTVKSKIQIINLILFYTRILYKQIMALKKDKFCIYRNPSCI